MKSSQACLSLIVATVIAVGTAVSAWAGDGPPLPGTPPADSALSLTRYYTAPLANVGEFPGNLVRLSCDANASATLATQREQPQHEYALMLQGDDTIHPLVAGTDEVRRQLSSVDLQGAEVRAQGKYYPSNGVIFVSSLTVRKPGTARDTAAAQQEMRRSSAINLSLARCASE